MSDIIAEIEKAIEKAADKHLREVNRNYNEIQQANMPNVLIGEGFDAGCAFILPLLKKAIELHNIDIDLMFSWSDECKEMRDKELLKLLGIENE